MDMKVLAIECYFDFVDSAGNYFSYVIQCVGYFSEAR
jgi:hypothetical protein